MSTTLGYSSELYFLDPADIAVLADTPPEKTAFVACPDKVIIFMGNAALSEADTLVCGREIVQQALKEKTDYIPVRFVFASSIQTWNILPIFFKKLRQPYKFTSHNVYHTTLSHLRALHIERGFRNAQNAYIMSKRWQISPEERIRRYQELSRSLQENGFDDKFPLAVMLCRRCGIKDCVDDGHHRIGICAEYNIERIAVKINAAGALPHIFQKTFLPIFNLLSKRQSNKSL